MLCGVSLINEGRTQNQLCDIMDIMKFRDTPKWHSMVFILQMYEK